MALSIISIIFMFPFAFLPLGLQKETEDGQANAKGK